jgi:hypothetical protein
MINKTVDGLVFAFVHSGSMTQSHLNLGEMLKTSISYWLCPNLPDDNVLFAGDHWLIIKCIIPSYHRFVNRGKKLNDFLGVEYEVRQNAFWRTRNARIDARRCS